MPVFYEWQIIPRLWTPLKIHMAPRAWHELHSIPLYGIDNRHFRPYPTFLIFREVKL